MRSPWPGTGHVNRNYGDLGERGYGRSGPPLSGQIHLNSYTVSVKCNVSSELYVHLSMCTATSRLSLLCCEHHSPAPSAL